MKSSFNEAAKEEIGKASAEVKSRVNQYLGVMQRTPNVDYSTGDIGRWSDANKQLLGAMSRAIVAIQTAKEVVATAGAQDLKQVDALNTAIKTEVGNIWQSIERIRTRDKAKDLFKPVIFMKEVFGDSKSEEITVQRMFKGIGDRYQEFYIAVKRYENQFNRTSRYGTFKWNVDTARVDTSEIKREFRKK